MTDLATQVPLAFAAGILSVLSPCVMPLMPAYLSLVSGVTVEELEQRGVDAAGLRRQVMRSAAGFIAGFTVVFVAMGVGAVAIGRAVRSFRVELFGLEIGLSQIAGLVIVVFGLHLAGLVRLPWLDRDTRLQLGQGDRGLLRTLLVGAGFALGWSPCIGPILGGVLTLAGSRETVWQGTALLLVYSAGLAIPFALAAFSLEFFFRAFGRVRHHFHTLQRISGGVLVLAGLLLLADQFTRFNAAFGFLNDWVVALEEALL